MTQTPTLLSHSRLQRVQKTFLFSPLSILYPFQEMVINCPLSPSPPGGGHPSFLRHQPRRPRQRHFEILEFRRPIRMPVLRLDSRGKEVIEWRESTIFPSPSNPQPPPASDPAISNRASPSNPSTSMSSTTSSNSSPIPSHLPSIVDFLKKAVLGGPAKKAGQDVGDADGTAGCLSTSSAGSSSSSISSPSPSPSSPPLHWFSKGDTPAAGSSSSSISSPSTSTSSPPLHWFSKDDIPAAGSSPSSISSPAPPTLHPFPLLSPQSLTSRKYWAAQEMREALMAPPTIAVTDDAASTDPR